MPYWQDFQQNLSEEKAISMRLLEVLIEKEEKAKEEGEDVNFDIDKFIAETHELQMEKRSRGTLSGASKMRETHANTIMELSKP